MIHFDLAAKRYAEGLRRLRSGAATSRDDRSGPGRGFGTERHPARLVFFSDAVFAIAVTLLVLEIRPPQDTRQRTAVVFYGISFEVAAILFNIIWEYARHGHRLLETTIDAPGARAIGRRFRLALPWIATGTLLGALLPVLGMVVIAAFIPFYWRPIPGEIARAKSPRDGDGPA